MNNFLKSNTTSYKGLASIYFFSILKNIIKIGNLEQRNITILDFGCGEKQLSKLLPNKKILNYDIKEEFTEHKDFRNLKFDVVILNHVLNYFRFDEIVDLFNTLKKMNPKCEIIIGIPKISWISRVAKYILLEFNAHKNFITDYETQLNLIKQNTNFISEKKNIFFSTNIYFVKIK
jgi:hypothetical protein